MISSDLISIFLFTLIINITHSKLNYYPYTVEAVYYQYVLYQKPDNCKGFLNTKTKVCDVVTYFTAFAHISVTFLVGDRKSV